MTKICFPHYECGEFRTLAKAIESLGATTYSLSRYALRDIVLYTPRYRDHLRHYGVEDLIAHLVVEAPQINDEPVLLHRLRRWAEESPLADYDIRCYNIKDKITILGHTFKGLADVRRYVEVAWCENENERTLGPSVGIARMEDMHVGCYYEKCDMWIAPYSANSRICQSYIFRQNPVSQSDMSGVLCSPRDVDFLKDHEGLDMAWLPLLYYPGEGKYMFLATRRDETL